MQYSHIEHMEKENKTLEIARLKWLLKWRKEEYAIFGACASDLEYDNEIKKQIAELSK